MQLGREAHRGTAALGDQLDEAHQSVAARAAQRISDRCEDSGEATGADCAASVCARAVIDASIDAYVDINVDAAKVRPVPASYPAPTRC